MGRSEGNEVGLEEGVSEEYRDGMFVGSRDGWEEGRGEGNEVGMEEGVLEE